MCFMKQLFPVAFRSFEFFSMRPKTCVIIEIRVNEDVIIAKLIRDVSMTFFLVGKEWVVI